MNNIELLTAGMGQMKLQFNLEYVANIFKEKNPSRNVGEEKLRGKTN